MNMTTARAQQSPEPRALDPTICSSPKTQRDATTCNGMQWRRLPAIGRRDLRARQPLDTPALQALHWPAHGRRIAAKNTVPADGGRRCALWPGLGPRPSQLALYGTYFGALPAAPVF